MRYFLFFMAVGLTLGTLWGVPQYRECSEELLRENWTMRDGKSGQARSDKGVFVLASDRSDDLTQIFQRLQKQGEGWQVRLSAEVRLENVIPGEKGWHKARLVLVQSDGKKNRYDVPHVVFQGEGSEDWQRYDTVFDLQDWAESYTVNMQMIRCTGKMTVRNLSLKGVAETRGYHWARQGVLAAWGLFFLSFAFSVHRNGRRFVPVLVVISLSVILFGTLIPVELKNEIVLSILAWLGRLQVLLGSNAYEGIHRVGHFICFFVFGVSCGILRPKAGMVYLLGQAGMIGAGTELAQFYIEGRSPMAEDFFIDMAGAFTGILLARVVLNVIERGHRIRQAHGDTPAG